jgi:chromosome segregation ATPase
MNKSLTNKESSVDKPSFDRINRFNVAIVSLKNQLKLSTNIDELTILASKIIELEQQIIVEKTAGYKKLEKEKKEIEDRIDKIKRELKRAEDDLQRIGNNLDLKVNGLRKTLQIRIDSLNTEYDSLVNRVNNLDE